MHSLLLLLLILVIFFTNIIVRAESYLNNISIVLTNTSPYLQCITLSISRTV
jgi:hypothetical protein